MEEQARGPDPTSGPASYGAQPRVQQHDPAAGEMQQGAAGAHAAGRKQLYDDHFMMWVWKVEMCKRVDKHDRENCPYAHPGELARRRHPSLYQALPCPEARAVSPAHMLLPTHSTSVAVQFSDVQKQCCGSLIMGFLLGWGSRLDVLSSRHRWPATCWWHRLTPDLAAATETLVE